MFYSGRHKSSNGITQNWSPADIDAMATNLNNLGTEHRPRAGVVYEKPNGKTGHGNTLIALSDTPSAGDVVNARTRDMILDGKTVRAIYADVENIPEKIFKIYQGGGFPRTSPEIVRDYMGNGPTIRALAFQGMMPPALKDQKAIDIYSSLYEEEEGNVYTLNFKEIQKENSMDPEEIKKLVAAEIKSAMSGIGAEITKSVTAQFTEFSKPPPAPERSKEDQTEIDRLNDDIKRRVTASRTDMVVRFGESLGKLKECEEGGQKKGLAPALIADITSFGTALADPESKVVKFAEGDEKTLLDAFSEVIIKVAKANPLNFNEIDVPGEGKTQAEADMQAGKDIQNKR